MPHNQATKNRVIRDPIHGLVPLDEGLRSIIDQPEFQRLRWIRQNGVSSYVFHGAEHSRFGHAIGSYATARKVYEHFLTLRNLARIPPNTLMFKETNYRAFFVAALCHDIGHCPFSHALEDAEMYPTGVSDHEECTTNILEDSKGLRKAISGYCDFDAVINIYRKSMLVPAFSQLVSGAYDVDKSDYLLRDTLFFGVGYGNFDFEWLVHTLSVSNNEKGLPIVVLDGNKGMEAFRQFLLARSQMYQKVYQHSTIRSAQLLLRAIVMLARAKFTRRPSNMSTHAARIFQRPNTSAQMSMENYLRITDVTVIDAIQTFAHSNKKSRLSWLASSFLYRQLPKAVLDSTRGEGIHLWANKENLFKIRAELEEICNGEATKQGIKFEREENAVVDAFRFVLEDDGTSPPVSLREVAVDVDGKQSKLSEIVERFAGEWTEFERPIRFQRLYAPPWAVDAAKAHLRSRGILTDG
jgi:uncharacterized protein